MTEEECPNCKGKGKVPKCICEVVEEGNPDPKTGWHSWGLKRNPKCPVDHNTYLEG